MNQLPKLITFDGEARSGKGTVVQATKDYLRDERGLNPMLIDRGQTFRALVVAAERSEIDLDDTAALDEFLTDPDNIEACVLFVKRAYHMDKSERDALLYTNEVGANSAKVGARAASQDFVRDLTKKWLHDARTEGFDVVLIDGRALEPIAREMHTEGLCNFRMGLYFICDAVTGARRTLGYAATQYDELTPEQRADVDQLVVQIGERNQRDFMRDSEPLVRPQDAPTCILPDMSPAASSAKQPPMLVIDTSNDMTRAEMSLPVAMYIANNL